MQSLAGAEEGTDDVNQPRAAQNDSTLKVCLYIYTNVRIVNIVKTAICYNCLCYISFILIKSSIIYSYKVTTTKSLEPGHLQLYGYKKTMLIDHHLRYNFLNNWFNISRKKNKRYKVFYTNQPKKPIAC